MRGLAKYFGISKERVCEMLRRELPSGFPCFQANGLWWVDLDELREWMCQRLEERAPAGGANDIRSKKSAARKRFLH